MPTRQWAAVCDNFTLNLFNTRKKEVSMTTLNIMVGSAQGSVPVTVLRVEGDIDAATHKILQDKSAEVIEAGTTHILLDLGGVNYMGSAGFRAIHAMANMLSNDSSAGLAKSEYLKLLNPTDAVARVIKTLGFDVYLDIYQDREEAVNSF
jgi:anti-anti-sigma factor